VEGSAGDANLVVGELAENQAKFDRSAQELPTISEDQKIAVSVPKSIVMHKKPAVFARRDTSLPVFVEGPHEVNQFHRHLFSLQPHKTENLIR